MLAFLRWLLGIESNIEGDPPPPHGAQSNIEGDPPPPH